VKITFNNKILLITAFSSNLILSIPSEISDLKFHRTQETLEKITRIINNKEKGVYFRFGDGDILLANGQSDMLQGANKRLQSEMQEALALNGKTILKTLPLYCKELGGWELGMFPGNHESDYNWCLSIIKKAYPLWGGNITDAYSHAALHFSATQNPDICISFLRFLKTSGCCLFVGNKNVPTNVRNILFGKDCMFVSTPSQQSYNEIDAIETACLAKIALLPKDSYKIIITAMGCSGRPLQKRLWNKLDNIFLFDFGSLLDALCGWDTRAWITLTHFDGIKFLGTLEKELGKD